MTLLDRQARPLRDLRISITDRCNFRCTYCMPREHFGSDHVFLPRSDLLTYEEIVTVVESLLPAGLEKVRLTGGEPLLRSDVTVLVRLLKATGPHLDLALTTNGALLSKHAKDLADAGLNRVTVSLDALDPTTFAAMADTTKTTPSDVLDGIDAAMNAGLGVKVNTVVRRGVNEDEILPLAEACAQRGVPLRFVEFMDVGNTNAWEMAEVVSGAEVRTRIEQRFGPLTPHQGQGVHEVARRFTTAGGQEFGFINSVTQPFCGDCSRARLSANGSLYTCLFSSSGNDLKAMLRMQATTDDIRAAIKRVWTDRNDRYSMERQEHQGSTQKVEMSFIGG
ncbi:MAG: GTP 3',8-cyclase MoaA [Poseidonia sp.]